jgi:hypothetical protein
MQQAFIFFIPGIQVLIQAAGQAHAVRGSSAFRRHVLSLSWKGKKCTNQKQHTTVKTTPTKTTHHNNKKHQPKHNNKKHTNQNNTPQ